MQKAVLLALVFVVGAASATAQAAALRKNQVPNQKREGPQAAKKCGSGVAGVLFLAGLAYATKSTAPLRVLPPCPQELRAAPQKSGGSEIKMPTPQHRLAKLPAAEAMREAILLYIRPRSSWFNRDKLERELLKRKEFGEMGLELTRSANHADLILEVTRKRFTTRFTCNFIEPTTERVLAGVTASSLGGEIEPDLAEGIIKQFKVARSKPATEEKK